MHPTDVDPGMTLAGRYRVAELLAEAPGDGGVAQTWRAVDEVLSRSVVVHVLSADDERAPVLLEASRRAATVSDARFIRVLDAMEEDGVAYVVREWVQGRSLATLLADGPLPPRNAGLIVREVAEALASAHLQGLTHERLDLDSVVVTDSGSIKIVGLATQAALTGGGEPATDPSHADALGLGRLLYASLTGRSPSGPQAGLEAALRAPDGSLLSPRQCLAGIPKGLDEITDRILSSNPRHGIPLDSPDQVSMALIEAVGITPPEGVLPPAASPVGDPHGGYGHRPPPSRSAGPYGGPGGGYPPPDDDRTQPFTRPPRAAYAGPPAGGPPPRAPVRSYRAQRPPRWRRAATLLVGLVLFAGLILLGWQLTQGAFNGNIFGSGNNDQQTPTNEDPTPKERDKPEKPYKISDGGDFDPLSEGGNGEENGEDVPLTYDGDPNTAWITQEYYDPMDVQGKNGVGFWVDLGKAVEVGGVELSLQGDGTDLEVYTAPQNSTSAPAELEGWSQFAQADGAGSEEKLSGDPARTRYVLVWLTELPPQDGSYIGGVGEIVVRP